MPNKDADLPVVFRWRPACWLRVEGADATVFLQGQFTNDLRGLPPGGAAYGLWLTVKGKVLADSFVCRAAGAGGDGFWIGSYFSPAGTIRSRLESYIISDDVVVTDETALWTGLTVFENGEIPPHWKSEDRAVFFSGRRALRPAWEIVSRVSDGEPAWLAAKIAGAKSADAVEMQRLRIAAGIPAVPADVGPADLPNEAGLDADAVSFTKGCYLGQEVMARLKSMGQVRRRLARVRGAGVPPPTVPAPLFAEARQAAELRSVAPDGEGGWIGLAMVSLLAVENTRALGLAAGATPAVSIIDPL